MPLVEVLIDRPLTPAVRKQLAQQIKEQVKKILKVSPDRIHVVFYQVNAE